MVSRRRFLGYSLAGILTAASGCRPENFKQISNEQHDSDVINPLLRDKTNLPQRKNYFLGYPVNMNTPSPEFFKWQKELQKVGIDEFAYNNVGNPFMHSHIPYNTHNLEEETIRRFGQLYGFNARDIWGFISHSGTDSNMHGMYMGRTILKGRTGVTPKCYFTREAHYSIQILGDLLGLDRIYVKTLPNAGMDPIDLKNKLSEHNNHPALVVATIGTTFKGGIDDVNKIQEVLNGHESYLHLDAALFGGYLLQTSGINTILHHDNKNHLRKRYDSIAVSCHKFFGFPAPAGLFITSASNFDFFNELYSTIHNPEYIGHVPGTITCSRDAVKPAEFYYYSTTDAIKQQAKDARSILKNATYLMGQLETHFPDLQPKRVSNLSNTIYFKKPGEPIVNKYSLATMHYQQPGITEDLAHVVVMPHANQTVLDEFLTDLDADKSLPLG